MRGNETKRRKNQGAKRRKRAKNRKKIEFIQK